MADQLTLIGYRYSVYTRIVQMTCLVLGLEPEYFEVDPFAAAPDPFLAQHTSLGRVPVLCHGDFILTETAAICRYLNDLTDGELVPTHAKAAAQMAQAIGIMDFYGYVPLVRQVFGQSVFRPLMENEPPDAATVDQGLAAAPAILDALNAIAGQGRTLNGTPTLADLHLSPMFSYFTAAPSGLQMMDDYPALNHWWRGISRWKVLTQTDPLTGF